MVNDQEKNKMYTLQLSLDNIIIIIDIACLACLLPQHVYFYSPGFLFELVKKKRIAAIFCPQAIHFPEVFNP